MMDAKTLGGLGLIVAAFSCTSQSAQTPPVFGGEGAAIAAKQTPLSEAPPEVDSGPCAGAVPSTNVWLEDFEDGNSQLFKVTGREGWWFVATDDTAGHAFPAVGDFTPSRLPANEATLENAWALHGSASEFKDWGAQWSTTIHWEGDGVKCPFNAMAFDGLTFRAKGSGSLHFKLGTPDTIPPEYEGRCKDQCWDKHGKRIYLQPEWQQVVVRFDKLQQEGWGTDVDFDPAHILSVDFAVHSRELPVDFWVDDLVFLVPGQPVPDLLAPAPALGPAPTAAQTPASPGQAPQSQTAPAAPSAAPSAATAPVVAPAGSPVAPPTPGGAAPRPTQ